MDTHDYLEQVIKNIQELAEKLPGYIEQALDDDTARPHVASNAGYLIEHALGIEVCERRFYLSVDEKDGILAREELDPTQPWVNFKQGTNAGPPIKLDSLYHQVLDDYAFDYYANLADEPAFYIVDEGEDGYR